MLKTGKCVNKNSSLSTNEGNNGWTAAIARAKEHLKNNRTQAVRLREAIKMFRKMARAGKPWPGLKTQQHRTSRIIGPDIERDVMSNELLASSDNSLLITSLSMSGPIIR